MIALEATYMSIFEKDCMGSEGSEDAEDVMDITTPAKTQNPFRDKKPLGPDTIGSEYTDEERNALFRKYLHTDEITEEEWANYNMHYLNNLIGSPKATR